MFKRLSNGLLSPKETSVYYKEKFGKTILYLLILVLFMLIPVVISTSTSSLVSESGRKEIRKSFTNETIPFTIVNGTLENINGDKSFVYKNQNLTGINFYITEDIKNISTSLNNLNIVLGTDKVYLMVSSIAYPVIEYKEYEYLTNLNLSDSRTINSLTFWDNIFNIMDNEYNKARPTIIVFSTIIYFFYWAAWLAIFACVLSLFSKMRYGNVLKFSGLFKVSIYNLTPFVFCTIFGSLFGMQLLVYVGYVVSAVYSLISTSKILENMYNTRKEER
ncbi:MAG: DUF1189 domain-containing protein [Acholeplasmataceae bacterium]|nr:DUF1189 domain-containing protein [Acholeplasmataceae bacterium]